MGIFDAIFPKPKPGRKPDLYVKDLEVVAFRINGVARKFVGGSFRGIPFFVESHELTTGRRLVVENLPNSDTNAIQDLGRRTRGFTFSAYLLGSDVFRQKRELIETMETGGIGELVHPYLGRFQARGSELSLSEEESTKEYVKIGLTFVVDSPQSVGREKSRPAALAAAKKKSDNALLAAFKAAWDTAGKALAVVDAANAAVNGAIDAVFAARESIRSVALFVEKIKAIKNNLEFLAGAPGLLGEALLDLINTEDDPDATIDYKRTQAELLSASAWSSETPNTSTSSGSDKQIKTNDQAITSLVKQATAGRAVEVTPAITYESTEEAGAVISSIVEALDAAELVALDDQVYYSALELKTSAAAYVARISKDLAQVELLELTQPTTALTLSYELYGDTDQALDIITRNRIPDPFFMPIAQVLEVLTDTTGGQ